MSELVKKSTIKKNIILSSISKMMVVFIGLYSMPLILDYLDPVQFGIYATITSIISWIDMFDIGLGQGLRNKLTEVFSAGNKPMAIKYISTSYFLMIVIAMIMITVFVPAAFFINWNKVLNIDTIASHDLQLLLIIVFIFFALRFASSLINKIFFAFHRSALVDITQLIGKIVFLGVIIILIHTSKSSLLYFGSLQSFMSFLIPFTAGILFFRFAFKEFTPQIKSIDLSLTKDLMVLGGKFFFIQICLVVIHSTNNFLISNFVGPAEVTTYQLAYQILIYLSVGFSILNTPLWSAYTNAWTLGKKDWIKKTIKRLILIYFVFLAVAVLIVAFSSFIFKVWIGDRVQVPTLLVSLVAFMILLNIWTSIFDFFINGVGKLRLQMYLTAFAALINIPLSYLLAVSMDMGTNGIVIASIVSFSISAIFSPIQAYKIIHDKAFGIWNL
ncbi:MAG TPA: hypothetical protein DIC42_05570 [Holosporales bacterium]|nr:hypothetical protein [Holosporales bacterium]